MGVLGILSCEILELEFAYLLNSDSDITRITILENNRSARLLEALVEVSSQASERAPAPPAARSRRSANQMRNSAHKTRREMLRVGAKLAYVAPSVLTITAAQALAAGSAGSGVCSVASDTGELCETDTDCCSGSCSLGICD